MQWKGRKTGKMSQGPKFCLQTQGREREGTTPKPSPQLHRHYTAAQLHDCLPSPTSSSLPSVSSIPPLFSKDSWFFFNPVAPLTKKPNYTNYYYYPPQNPTCEQGYLQPTDTQTMHNPGQPRINGREATLTIYCTHLNKWFCTHLEHHNQIPLLLFKVQAHGFMDAFSEKVRLINPVRQWWRSLQASAERMKVRRAARECRPRQAQNIQTSRRRSSLRTTHQ